MPLRVIVCLVLAVQVIVGQALPLGGGRPLNPVAMAIAETVNRHAGEVAAWVLGILLLCSVVHRWSVCLACAIYALYTAVVARQAFALDPYIGVLYVAYAILGLYVAATAWGRHAD